MNRGQRTRIPNRMTKRASRKRSRKSPKPRTPPRPLTIPAWFPVDESPPWSEVVEAPRTFAGVWRGVWEDNERQWLSRRFKVAQQMARVEFVQNLTGWARDLGALDLRRLSTAQLMSAFQRAYWGETVIANLVPISYSPDRTVRLAAAYDTLIGYGILKAAGDRTHPLDWATAVVTAQLPNVPVWDELLRRGDEHAPGFAVALLRLGHELSRLDTPADETVEAAGRVFGGDDHVGQALLTVDKEWGDLDPFQAFEHALFGKLDGAKTVVKRDEIDEWRKFNRHTFDKEGRTLTFQFDERGDDDVSHLVSREQDREAAESWREHQKQEDLGAEVRAALQKLCSRHPAEEFSAYTTARLAGMNQTEAAATAAVSTRMARKYDSRLRADVGLRRAIGLD